MKIFLFDEIYEYLKSTGDHERMVSCLKQYYDTSSIKAEMESIYNATQSESWNLLLEEITTKLQKENPRLYRMLIYSNTQSEYSTEELLNTTKDMTERFILLDQVISYKVSEATEYDITLTAFVTIYEEVAEEYRQMLPKYVHLAYYKYSNIKYCTSLGPSDKSAFESYEDWLKTQYDKVSPYIKSKDTMDNATLELRAVALQYIATKLTNEQLVSMLEKLELLADPENMDFDNRYLSVGVIWLLEKIYEIYFDRRDYYNFFRFVMKSLVYIDNALANKERLFDALRYYNMNNTIGFAISIRRFLYIANLFPTFNFKLENLPETDIEFLTNKDLSYDKYDSLTNRQVLEKFKEYVDRWYGINKNRLKDLSEDIVLLEKLKESVLSGIAYIPEEETYTAEEVVPNVEDPDNTVPPPTEEDTTTTTEVPGNTDPEVNGDEDTVVPDLPPLPDGFTVNIQSTDPIVPSVAPTEPEESPESSLPPLPSGFSVNTEEATVADDIAKESETTTETVTVNDNGTELIDDDDLLSNLTEEELAALEG